MTDLLYQTDAYQIDFSAEVVSVNEEENGIILNRTAFYPGGGGQPNDIGKFIIDGQDVYVTKVKRGNLHIIDGNLPEVGTVVSGHVDWDRRYKLMRTHTAMHILCGVVWRDYQASVTGGNMDVLSGRMDFEFERMQKELVTEIEEKINIEIAKERDIVVKILPREDAFLIPGLIRTKINLLPEGIAEVRTVEIEGLDLQADGGTHVSNTREVGKIKITNYKSKGGINKRIYVEIED